MVWLLQEVPARLAGFCTGRSQCEAPGGGQDGWGSEHLTPAGRLLLDCLSPHLFCQGATCFIPRLRLQAGTKMPIIFHGNRTVSHLVQFAEEHGSKPLDLDPSISLDDVNEL